VIFVDSNVLIDVLTPDQDWRDWSRGQITELIKDDDLVVNSVVVAELASNFPDLEGLLGWFSAIPLAVRPLDEEVAFLAGQAFRVYRRRHGARVAILSDFLIGGHARHLGAVLLTRDAAIYRAYFPDLTLVTPENEND